MLLSQLVAFVGITLTLVIVLAVLLSIGFWTSLSVLNRDLWIDLGRPTVLTLARNENAQVWFREKRYRDGSSLVVRLCGDGVWFLFYLTVLLLLSCAGLMLARSLLR
jgi:hypothetical protein